MKMQADQAERPRSEERGYNFFVRKAFWATAWQRLPSRPPSKPALWHARHPRGGSALLSERLVPGGGLGPGRKQCSPSPGRQGTPLYPVRRTSSCLQCS